QRTSKNPEFVEKVAHIQVHRSVEGVIERSMVLREMIEKGDLGLVGAMYNVATGAVSFLEHTWMCGSVKHFYLDASMADGSKSQSAAIPIAAAKPQAKQAAEGASS